MKRSEAWSRSRFVVDSEISEPYNSFNMNRISRRLLLLIGVCGDWLIKVRAQAQQAGPGANPRRFAGDIAAFLEEDRKNSPPPGGILFIGSSIFRLWASLKEQMAPLPVFNRAFGGSQTADLLYYQENIVFPYKPRIIVYYCGSNDINDNIPPETIFDRFRQFSERVSDHLPDTRLYFVSINRAPQKKDKWDPVDAANALVKAYCARTSRRGYIDVNPALFDRHGKPRIELYQPDQLHFKPEAYVGFTAIIRPVLEKAWKERAQP